MSAELRYDERGKDVSPSVESVFFEDDGSVPNNPSLPFLIYSKVLDPSLKNLAAAFESLYESNGWQAAWRWGVYDFHHYHSTAHEVLGCFSGSAKVLFGGENGRVVEISAGDLVVIPAGVGHKKLSSSFGFQVAGGYPPNQDWDLNRGSTDEHRLALENIPRVPLPETDPIYGDDGPLVKLWNVAR